MHLSLWRRFQRSLQPILTVTVLAVSAVIFLLMLPQKQRYESYRNFVDYAQTGRIQAVKIFPRRLQYITTSGKVLQTRPQAPREEISAMLQDLHIPFVFTRESGKQGLQIAFAATVLLAGFLLLKRLYASKETDPLDLPRPQMKQDIQEALWANRILILYPVGVPMEAILTKMLSKRRDFSYTILQEDVPVTFADKTHKVFGLFTHPPASASSYDAIVYVYGPNAQERAMLLEASASRAYVSGVSFQKIAEKTLGMTDDGLQKIVFHAAQIASKKKRDHLQETDFFEAIETLKKNSLYALPYPDPIYVAAREAAFCTAYAYFLQKPSHYPATILPRAAHPLEHASVSGDILASIYLSCYVFQDKAYRVTSHEAQQDLQAAKFYASSFEQVFREVKAFVYANEHIIRSLVSQLLQKEFLPAGYLPLNTLVFPEACIDFYTEDAGDASLEPVPQVDIPAEVAQEKQVDTPQEDICDTLPEASPASEPPTKTAEDVLDSLQTPKEEPNTFDFLFSEDFCFPSVPIEDDLPLD